MQGVAQAVANVFGDEYAAVYDAIYADKDYAKECDTVEALLQRCGVSGRRIIDIGCGTGGHARQLAARGFDVTGVDLSAAMLEIARAQSVTRTADDTGTPVRYVAADMADAAAVSPAALGRFDAVLVMFAALGYQTSNAAVEATFANLRAVSHPGSVLIFDVWYGPAVLNMRPQRRSKTFDTSRGTLVRCVTPHLDVRTHTCTTLYELSLKAANAAASSAGQLWREEHRMRFFFPMELESLLERHGFALHALGEFPDIETPANETCWNAWAVAVATSATTNVRATSTRAGSARVSSR